MKQLFTILLSVVCAGTFAQNTCTSVMSGNATSPLTWNCVPSGFVPLPGDDVIINTNVTLDNDWAYSSGSLTINAGASLVGDIPSRAVWVDGGTFTNDGLFEVANFGTNSGIIINNGTMDIDLGYYNASVNMTNNGSIVNADSLWNNGAMYNPGTINCNQFWNSNSMVSDGDITSINFLNTGEMSNTAVINCNYFGSSGDFDNSGSMYVANDMANWELFGNGGTGFIQVEGDFWNADSAANLALMTNNGFVRVNNSWYNNDTIIGSGKFCVSNSTINGDYVGGTIDLCDLSGGGIDINTGTIGSGVSFCALGPDCSLGVNDNEAALNVVTIMPNPANDYVYLETPTGIASVRLIDASGREVLARFQQMAGRYSLQRNNLEPGMYYIQVVSLDGSYSSGKLIFR